MKIFQIIGLAVILFLGVQILISSKKTEENEYQQAINENYKVYAIPLDKDMNFAGEKAPLNDFEVRERIDREILSNTFFHSSTIRIFKKANRWFPIFEKILAEKNIPEDFKYLAVVETGLNNAVSPKKATGFWQFMEKTGKEYGLEINDYVDERYDPIKSTYAACEYLKDAYEKFGSWTLVAASYNMGMEGLQRRVNEQKANNYYDLYLNLETARYVPRLLAVKTILQNPKKYGFHFRKTELYKPLITKQIKVDSTIKSLPDFALSLDITYKHLKVLNPWLRRKSLQNPKGKTYIFQIPDTKLLETGSLEEKDIFVPEFFEDEKIKTIEYLVKANDNLQTIADSFGVSTSDIETWNNLDSLPFTLKTGQKLLIKVKE